jgi:hypothetical protein
MGVIGVSGVRKLAITQVTQAEKELEKVLRSANKLHVGDALGIDAIALKTAKLLGLETTEHKTEGYQPWQLQQRSKRMIDALAKENGMLHAWVNKPCPEGLTVTSWKGSGTWGTVRYAVSKGVKVELHKLIDCPNPDWLATRQICLLAM